MAAVLIALAAGAGACAKKANTGVRANQDFCAGVQRPGDGYPAAASPVTGVACGEFTSPALLREGDTCWMWYGCGPDIRLASSQDGDRWTDEGAVTFSGLPRWAELGLTLTPSVALRAPAPGGPAVPEFHMWFTGVDSSGVPSIGHAVSTDRRTWTVDADSVLSSVHDPALTWDGTRFVGWVSAAFAPYSIYRLTSLDGRRVTQILEVFRPLDDWEAGGVTAPTLLEAGGQYHLWYQGWNRDRTASRIGYARSGDGVSWSRCADNPVLSPAGSGWESAGVGDPEALEFDGRVRLYYAGRGATGRRVAGYAIALPNCLGWDCFGL